MIAQIGPLWGGASPNNCLCAFFHFISFKKLKNPTNFFALILYIKIILDVNIIERIKTVQKKWTNSFQSVYVIHKLQEGQKSNKKMLVVGYKPTLKLISNKLSAGMWFCCCLKFLFRKKNKPFKSMPSCGTFLYIRFW